MKAEDVLKYPLVTEKAVRMMNTDNKLLFVVHSKANKADVKKAVEKSFDAKVDKVNIYTTNKGERRAYIKFNTAYPAMDIMTRLGLM